MAEHDSICLEAEMQGRRTVKKSGAAQVKTSWVLGGGAP